MTENVKILIVDDEERLRESLKKMLVMDGFSVETAEDGKAGLSALLSSSFDVAIIDLVMPKHDGMWLIGEINKRNIDVSVVVATGYGTVELVVKAMKQGAWDFIQKPVDYELMRMVVGKAADRRSSVRAQHMAEKRIREQNLELKEVNEKLKELDKLKTDFLSMAVHELRTPLTVIICALEMVRVEIDDNNISGIDMHVSNALEFARNMGSIVSEMLDIYTIESGNLSGEMTKNNLSMLVSSAAKGTAPLLKKKGIDLKIDIPEMPGDIVCSEGRIRQVVVNLIGNAVKFTPDGGTIAVSVKEESGGGVTISVKDNGCGILPENVDRIFDEFFQVNRGSEYGTGLGLAICRKIIDGHGGRIWAESEVDIGTTISFYLPA
ncbi:MAG: ATP-binding protein [bacterium]|nr:ATP-binding protein [bacterium]